MDVLYLARQSIFILASTYVATLQTLFNSSIDMQYTDLISKLLAKAN